MFKKFVSIVALVALLAMTFSFFACNAHVEIIEEEADGMIEFTQPAWTAPVSRWLGFPIALNHADENAVFECAVDIGTLVKYRQPLSEESSGQKMSVKPGETVFWYYETIEQAFVDIILKVDDVNIGYAVVEIYKTDGTGTSIPGQSYYNSKIWNAVLFPKNDGGYQNVTDKYVSAEIGKIKSSCSVELDGARYVLNGSAAVLTIYKGDDSRFTVPKEVTIDGTSRPVSRIGDGAFQQCAGLTEVVFAEGSAVEIIGNKAFSHCSALKSIALPDSVKEIWQHAFSDCAVLESVTVPNGLTLIGFSAFSRCPAIQRFTIPNSVTIVSRSVFFGWTNAQSIRVQTHTSAPAEWDYIWDNGSTAQILWGVD